MCALSSCSQGLAYLDSILLLDEALHLLEALLEVRVERLQVLGRLLFVKV